MYAQLLHLRATGQTRIGPFQFINMTNSTRILSYDALLIDKNTSIAIL